LEALSSGVPVLATAQGAIPLMLDDKTGVVMHDINQFSGSMETIVSQFINKSTANACRRRYKKNFSLKEFEQNLIEIFNK
jgi:glycosyltransferase involved in cell wall biosynthesis